MAAAVLPVADGDVVTTDVVAAMAADPDAWPQAGPEDDELVPLFDDDGVLMALVRLADDEPA